MRSTQATLLAIASLTLAACGGGGGGGGGSNGGGPNVAADIALSASTLTFSSVQNGPPPPSQTITVSATGGTFGTNGTVSLTTEFGGTAVQSADITNCSGSTCSLVVTARGNAAPGSYTDQVTLKGCTNFGCVTPVGSPKILTVTLTVGSGATLTSPAAVTIFAAPNTAPVAQQLLVQSTDASATWVASITYEAGTSGWLAPIANGTGSAQALLQVAPMPAGAYRARVTFQPANGGTGSSTVVALSVREPRVTFVTPYVAAANEPGRVTIRGFGFNALGASQVTFGAAPGTNVELTSDTEIRVDAPSLQAGRYPVAVSPGGGAPPLPGAAELVVVAPPAFAYKALPRSGGPSGLRANQLIYDAERQKIFVYDPDSSPVAGAPASRIERYRFDNGDWKIDEPIGFPLSGDVPFPTSSIALTPDGRELLRTGRYTVARFDPAQATPAVPLETVDARNALGAEINLMGAAMANDGSFVGPAYRSVTLAPSAYRYDAVERAFYLLTAPASWTHAEFRMGLPTPSGRTVSLVYVGAGLARPIFEYSASTGELAEVSSSGTLQLRISSYNRDETVSLTSFNDGTGERLEVRRPSPQFPGLTEIAVLSVNSNGAVVSPDGTRLYYYTADDDKVHVLDLEHTQLVQPVFPEIGASAPIDAPGAGAQMLVTPDGGSLVIAGKDRVIVMPAP
jgi:hypothetical protein